MTLSRAGSSLGVGAGHGADPERGAERRFLDGGAFQVLAGVGVYAHVDLAHVSREGFRAVGKKPCTCSSAGPTVPRSDSRAVQSTSPAYSPRVWCSSILLAMSASSSEGRMSSWDSSHSSIHWRSSPLSMVLCSMSGAFTLSVVRMIHRPWSRRSGVSAGHDVYKGR